MRALVLVVLAGLLSGTPRQEAVDPALRDAVLRFYATQQAEDLDGYLALWSRTARRPPREQLQFIFDSGDDTFSDIDITRVMTVGERVRVRVSAMRHRTVTGTQAPEGRPTVYHTRLSASLTFARESGALRLVSEGSPDDDLAAALLDAPGAAEREALLAAEPDLLGNALVSALSRRAGDLARAGDFRGSQTVFERVLEVARRIGDHKTEGEAFQNIANALYFQQDFGGALPWYEQRLELERAQANEEGIAAALLGVATIRYTFYEYATALVSYRDALAIQEKLADRSGVATTLVSTGNIAYLQGDYEASVADFRRSHGLMRKAFNLMGAARALEGLGRALAAQGDFAGALQAYAGVLEEGRTRNDHNLQGRALQSIGEIHFRIGNLDVARKLFEESRGHFLALKEQASVGRVWQATALTELVAARFPAAEEAYGRSVTVCESVRDAACVARAIVGLAFAQSAQSNYDAAVAAYQKGIAAFATLDRREEAARAEVGLSQALLGKGDAAAATAAALRAREAGVALGRDDVVWRARIAEARASRKAGSLERAMAAALDAAAAVERLAQASLDNPLDLVPGDSAGAYAFLAVLQASAGDPAASFATLERGRVHALRAALARNERDIARGMTADERDGERHAAAGVASLHVQIDRERALPKPDADRIARLQSALSAAVSARASLLERVFARLPDLRAARGLLPPVSADALGEVLADERTVVAEFVLDDDDLLVITARRVDGRTDVAADTTAIPRREIAERIAAMLDPAVLRDPARWRTSAAALVAAVPANAFARIAGAARVLLAPDDVLWRVPFEALPVEGGWMGERTTVTSIHSVTAVLRAPAAAPVSPGGRVVLVAAPRIPQPVRDRFSATAPGWALRPAASAEAEARRVASVYDPANVTLLAAADATEAQLRAEAPAATVLHIAAPLRVNSASPLFSPLLLGGRDTDAPGESEDGILEAHDITGLQFSARAVVISDGTALAMRDAAAALPVVQWTWRVAGVPALVVPRWQQDDAAASAEFLAQLHARLKAGDDPAVAAHAAAAVLRGRDDTRAPYFWAGWIVGGR